MAKTVLIADSYFEGRELLQAIVGKPNYQTIVCESAEEAVSRLDEADALIADFSTKTSGMNGVELAEIAKRQKPKMPVLIVASDPDRIPNGYSAGMVFTKPFRSADILSWLAFVR